MFAEGVHSVVNAANSIAIMVGQRKSERPADETHPFGYGKELYFWTLIIAILIFAVASGAILFEALFELSSSHTIRDSMLVYTILGIAGAGEAVGIFLSLREFLEYRKEKGGSNLGFLDSIRENRNPSTLTNLFEHVIACAGIVIVLIAVFLDSHYGKPIFDPIGSVAIGVLLGGTAIFLVAESRSLLIGERAVKYVVESVRKLAEQETEVESVDRILTMHLGPEEVLLNMNLCLKQGLSSKQIGLVVERIKTDIQKAHPEFRQIFIDLEDLK